MRGAFFLKNPDTVEATLAVTMPLGEWKRLRDQLKDAGWPGVRLSSMISALVYSAEREFSEVEKEAQ